jgi:hypothetical protein
MTTIDPTKKNQFVSPLPPTSPAPTKEKKLDLDAAPAFAPKGLGTYFANASGVSSVVFGNISPNPKSMTDDALSKNIVALGNAMRGSPGKVSDNDFRLLKAMSDEAATRAANKLAITDPKSLTNEQLFATLVGYDAARATGMPLTKEQVGHHEKLSSEWKTRTAYTKDAALRDLAARREHLVSEKKVKCGAAVGGTIGLVHHGVGAATTAFVIGHALHQKDYKTVFAEALTFAASRTKHGVVAELVSIGANALECDDLGHELLMVDQAIKHYEAKP